MKKILIIISILTCLSSGGQTSKPIELLSMNSQSSFSTNRERVWETLSNLPIEESDWRYDDLKKNYLKKWQMEIFGTAIFYVTTISGVFEETPSMYFATSPEGPSRIELDASKFTETDDENHCLEHELGHAAFQGNTHIPGWLLYLGNITSKEPGTENSMPFERIVRAIVLRRDILDFYALPINSVITDKQLQDYISSKSSIMDFGLKWIIANTREDRLIPLLNFENGYSVNERLDT